MSALIDPHDRARSGRPRLTEAEDNTQAILRYRDALVYRTNDVELRTSLGAALARAGNRAEARDELQSALRLNPNFEPAQRILAAIQ